MGKSFPLLVRLLDQYWTAIFLRWQPIFTELIETQGPSAIVGVLQRVLDFINFHDRAGRETLGASHGKGMPKDNVWWVGRGGAGRDHQDMRVIHLRL